MEFSYDPAVGVRPVPQPGERYKAGPNPSSAPMLDPIWQKKLDSIGARIGAPLRWHWMGESNIAGTPGRCWSIQQKGPRGWQTVFCVYDELGIWSGNHFPFKMPDDRDLKEFCEASLRIKWNTGDEDEDLRLNNKSVEEAEAAVKEKREKEQTALINAVITGGDAKRFGRLLQHENMHAGPGIRFTEYWPGAKLGTEGG